MSALVIKGFADGKKIHAIKGIRAVTGFGLKESKDIMDRAAGGEDVRVPESPSWRLNEAALRTLAEHGIEFDVIGDKVSLRSYVGFLARYPRTMTVGQLLDALEATRQLLTTQEIGA